MRTLLIACALTVVTGPANAYDCSAKAYQADRAKIMLALGTGILKNDRAGGVSVLVDDGYWQRLTLPEKGRFAEQIVCAAVGPGEGLTGLTLKSLSTGKVIAEWRSFGGLSVR